MVSECNKYRGQYPWWETAYVLCSICIPVHLSSLTCTVSPAASLQHSIADHVCITQKPLFLANHMYAHSTTHHFLTLNLTLVWWGPWLGSSRVLMANGADIVMSDQSSCLPSQQHISHSYKFSALAQAEDLDAYLMFIFYRSHLRRPVCEAKSLKRWQSPYIARSCLTESNKCVLRPVEAILFVIMKKVEMAHLRIIMRWSSWSVEASLQLALMLGKCASHQLNKGGKKKVQKMKESWCIQYNVRI